MKTKQEQIEEMVLDVPQTIVAYDANPKGQHLYGEQRLQIAEALYNAGYRKIDENCAVITKAELKEYKRQAVKEFAERLKKRTILYSGINVKYEAITADVIDELLKEITK